MTEKEHKSMTTIPGGDSLTERESGKLMGLVNHLVICALGDDAQSKIASRRPVGAFKKLGLRFYNQNLRRFVSECEKAKVGEKKAFTWKNRREREKVISEFKHYIQNFRAMVDRAIEGARPTRKDEEILRGALLKGELLTVVEDPRTGRFLPAHSMKVPKTEDIFWLWVYLVWREEIRVKHCRAEDCEKIFILVRSDQEYCSVNCRTRAFHQRKRHRRLTDSS